MIIQGDTIKKIIKEFEKEFKKEEGDYWKEFFMEMDGKIISSLLPKTPSMVKEFIIKVLIKQKEEVKKKLERIKLDMDVVICDCGESYKDSDPANLINEWLENL